MSWRNLKSAGIQMAGIILTAIVLVTNGLGQAPPSPAAPAPVAPLMRSPSKGRPLVVQGANPAVLSATVEGPTFHAPEHFQAFEDYYHRRLKRLREEYHLDQVVAKETNEFRRLLKLRHWVHTRWPIDNDQNFSGDAFAILEQAKTGAGFHCAHAMVVQEAVLSAMGYVARNLGVDRDHRDLGRSAHHGVNQVWSNDYAKWVVFDAKYDVHFEREGVPLSAMDLHERVRNLFGVLGPEVIARVELETNKPVDPNRPRTK